MSVRLLLSLWLVMVIPFLGACGKSSEASRPQDKPVALYVIAAPSGQQRTCQLQGELIQSILLKIMRPGDSLRLAVGRKDVADFAFNPGVELAEAARRDKVGPQWQKVRQHFQAAVQYGGLDQPLDMAVILPQVMDWAATRGEARKVVVLLGQVRPLPGTAPGERERGALKGVTVHIIDPESPRAPGELRQDNERLDRSFAALGGKLATFSTSPSAIERLRLADDQSGAVQAGAPSASPMQGDARQWRIRARWQNLATDYDLYVRQEVGGETHRVVSASSHQRQRLPRTWEEVSLATVRGAEVVELRLYSGPVDPELAVEVYDPDGQLVKTTVVGFLFQGRGLGEQASATRTVVMKDLLPLR